MGAKGLENVELFGDEGGPFENLSVSPSETLWIEI